MIRNYIKITFRNILKNKIFSFINITGLSIGLTAAMLILLYTKDEVSYDKFHANNPNIHRIVSAWMKPDGSLDHRDGNTGDIQGPKFKEKVPEIEAFVRVQGEFKDVRSNGEIKGYEMLAADSNFFSVFTLITTLIHCNLSFFKFSTPLSSGGGAGGEVDNLLKINILNITLPFPLPLERKLKNYTNLNYNVLNHMVYHQLVSYPSSLGESCQFYQKRVIQQPLSVC
ncbi:MAG: ABC transporter permease [Chitinophagales bacterium]|nr:ABC transporter permease [Chitinophagales bacterium]